MAPGERKTGRQGERGGRKTFNFFKNEKCFCLGKDPARRRKDRIRERQTNGRKEGRKEGRGDLDRRRMNGQTQKQGWRGARRPGPRETDGRTEGWVEGGWTKGWERRRKEKNERNTSD
jgi:hypothetical protein